MWNGMCAKLSELPRSLGKARQTGLLLALHQGKLAEKCPKLQNVSIRANSHKVVSLLTEAVMAARGEPFTCNPRSNLDEVSLATNKHVRLARMTPCRK